MDLPKAISLNSHNPFKGGVVEVIPSPDCKTIYTLGADQILRIWHWKYQNAGRRNAAEAEAAIQAMYDDQTEAINTCMDNITSLLTNSQSLQEKKDDPAGRFFSSLFKPDEIIHSEVTEEKDSTVLALQSKVQAIREKVLKAMQKNEAVPTLEKLDREEFTIDLKERDRLLSIADGFIDQVRNQIETENLKKKVIRSRIKHECWDSMEVIGQSVKSFNTDPLTSRIIEVLNYPIRKRSKAEQQKIDRVKRLRKVQLLVSFATEKRKDGSNESQANGLTEDNLNTASNRTLLYEPIELISNERRRIQALLINEYLLEIKKEFNNKFKDISRLKQDEISRIEEKNERITAILQEIDVNESVFHPELDSDEVPEKIIVVKDEEIKEERYLTAEERKKMEEKAKADRERLLMQQEDNFRERALTDMMNGKLEDRAENEQKEVLVRPEWMDKPKEEMTEEERKLVKEFDKKLAILKEEQEKERKAIETELKKCQSGILEICQGYDSKLRDLFGQKIDTDILILQNELKIIKLSYSALKALDSEKKDAALAKKLDFLKNEKQRYLSEVPESKKELEKAKEDYDSSVKKDKEVEKSFKKEMHIYEQHFEALSKLFKRRALETVVDDAFDDMFADQSMSPYAKLEQNIILDNVNIPPLNPDLDAPEGLASEIWNKLVEFREKKLATEREVRNALKKLHHHQNLVAFMTEQSEKTKNDLEKCLAEIEAFQEYKLQQAYNVETLYSIKQGQVEVPQAPMVTDYSDGILIHRSVVEKLNNQITKLGKSKVDALIEMKNYRKGIHALEWENRMLDFQGEDLVIKIRDIQLLRVTKQMQEFLRSGDEHKQGNEINALEKRAEYGNKAHDQKLIEKKKLIQALKKKIDEKKAENERLTEQVASLETAVKDRKDIYQVSAKRESNHPLQDIYTRRRLVDLAKSQAQDIAILREEVERLRLRTYPAFHAS